MGFTAPLHTDLVRSNDGCELYLLLDANEVFVGLVPDLADAERIKDAVNAASES